ncbi:hypothetical protein ACF0H5_008490 [Mactra antiquata]
MPVDANRQETKSRSLLNSLLRVKRFDFNMFGCSNCHPVGNCGRDSDCLASHGRQYECSFQCCSFVCVRITDRDDDDRVEAERANGLTHSHSDKDQRPNGNEDEIADDDMATVTIIVNETPANNVTQDDGGSDVTDYVMNP